MFSAFVLNNPIDLIKLFNRRIPRSRNASGLLAAANSFLVAKLTLTSVACAERITAISSSKGV